MLHQPLINQIRVANAGLSTFLADSSESIEVLPPAEHGNKLVFQVFCNGMPIAFARLQKQQVDIDPSPNRVTQLITANLAAKQRPAWCLKLIQVSQNYRNYGIGTLLMQEIIHYCHNNNIKRLIGEMKGDLPALQRWYQANGFNVDDANNIELLLD